MKIGLMSDSHGRVVLVRQALAIFTEARVDALIHCGDVGGLEVLEELAGWRCWFVWGNSDFPSPAWRAVVEQWGLPWPEGPLNLVLAGKRIAIYHGHEPGFHEALTTARHDYLCHGHSHQRRHEHHNGMKIINPGALHRTSRRSVALLDVITGQVEFRTLT